LSGAWEITIGVFVISLIGYVLITVGAFLGGSLVFRMGTMINRNAYRKPIKEFTPAIAQNELAQDTLKRVEVKGQPILLVRRGDQIFAVGAVCSHYGAPLEKGKLKDDSIECPFHYSLFSLADGRVKHGPSTSPLPTFETRVNQGQIEVKSI
jgi:nitrite reductase/ring-hydroxylating ferredoxin subunit